MESTNYEEDVIKEEIYSGILVQTVKTIGTVVKEEIDLDISIGESVCSGISDTELPRTIKEENDIFENAEDIDEEGSDSQQKSNVLNHFKVQIKEKPFSCQHCENRYAIRSSLMRHLRKCPGEEPYSCLYCEYRTSRRPSLIKHLRTHTKEKPFSCPYCEYRSSKRSNLSTHLRRHAANKSFACSLCEFKFPSKLKLAKHLKTHKRPKPFSCCYCKYKSPGRARLVIHMRTHTGEKPFLCSFCEYKGSLKAHLAKHMKTHREAVDIEAEEEVQRTSPNITEVKATLKPFERPPSNMELYEEGHLQLLNELESILTVDNIEKRII